MASRIEKKKELADADTDPGFPSKPAAEPDLGSVANVVTGPAAHDPLAHGEVRPSILNLGTWLAAKRLRPVETAAFVSWARTNAPGERPADEWAALFVTFQKTPIK